MIFRKIQESGTVNEKTTIWEYCEMEFYGPFVKIRVREEKDARPYVELVEDSYKVEDSSVAIGINRIMLKVAKELFKVYGPYSLSTRFGIVYIKNENVEKVFEDLVKSINLF